ncbi:substrate-binding periplasmic protein [Dongshaea marina]|uniref:substrate-binding periplasmic protein n=1 Tax=Dongshaea marina TaxID=2047966 RepID=UPI00131F2F15|nr:transporter substrate-binding domain-containing protein [Dongshaea marina]
MQILLLIILLTFQVAAFAGQRVNICYEDTELKPFILGYDNYIPDHPGLAVEMVLLAARASGLEVAFHRSPWKRCLREVELSRMDGMFAAIWSSDRERFAVFPRDAAGDLDSRRYFWQLRYPIYVRFDSKVSWDGKQFSGLTTGIGSPPGYIAAQRLKSMGAYAKNIYLPDGERGLKMVALGRIDGYILNEDSAREMISQYRLGSSLKVLPRLFIDSKLYLIFSRKYYQESPEQAEQFWDEITKVRESSGKALLIKYMLAPREASWIPLKR